MTESYRTNHQSKNYGTLYNKTYEKGYYFYQWEKLEKPILKEIFSKLSKNYKTYCDFACGTGRILSFAEHFFDRTYGIDISREMAMHAQTRCTKSKIFIEDITKKDIDLHVDVISSFRFFLNAEPSLREEALQTIKRILNPEGIFICNIHMNKRSILGFIYECINKILSRTKYNTLTKEEITHLLEINGFEVEKIIWYSYLPRTGWKMPWLSRFCLQPLDHLMKKFSFLPQQWAQSFILICRKKG